MRTGTLVRLALALVLILPCAAAEISPPDTPVRIESPLTTFPPNGDDPCIYIGSDPGEIGINCMPPHSIRPPASWLDHMLE